MIYSARTSSALWHLSLGSQYASLALPAGSSPTTVVNSKSSFQERASIHAEMYCYERFYIYANPPLQRLWLSRLHSVRPTQPSEAGSVSGFLHMA